MNATAQTGSGTGVTRTCEEKKRGLESAPALLLEPGAAAVDGLEECRRFEDVDRRGDRRFDERLLAGCARRIRLLSLGVAVVLPIADRHPITSIKGGAEGCYRTCRFSSTKNV